MRSPTGFLCSKLSTWRSKIKQSSSNGKWREVLYDYREMQRDGVQLYDPLIIPLILKACAKLTEHSQGKSIHANLIKRGFDSLASVGNSITDFYVKCGELDSALTEFDCMSSRDSVSWNIIVFGLLDHGFSEKGLWWFWKSRVSGVELNVSTLVLVIQACRRLGANFDGQKVHGYVIRTGLLAILSVQNSILGMYAEADMECARKLFDKMYEKDVISWSLMIRGFVQSQEPVLGLELFQKMIREGRIEPDGITIISVLKACTLSEDIDTGRSIHGFAIHKGFRSSDFFVENSLIDMYSKCNDANSAFKVFNEMTLRNIVSWNSMVSGFVHNHKYQEALSVFYSMGKQGFETDEVTLVSLLHICKFLVQLLPCKSVHCVMIRQVYETNEPVLNSLIDAYTNCNLVEHARKLFAGMKKKDVVSWSTMIAGLTRSGKPDEAITIFCEMNVKPNAITLINLLEACSILADLRKCKWAHGIAIRISLASDDVFVGTALVDAYAKCGAIEVAKRAFDQISEKNVISWTAVISAYGMNGLPEEALASLDKMKQQGFTPNSITFLTLLSACSHGGLIKKGLKILRSMVQDQGLKPSLQHYSCVIDMLSRGGELEIAMELIKNLPEDLKAGASAWGAFLSGCRNHRNSELGSEAVPEVLELEPLCSSGYLLGLSVFAAGNLWEDALAMRRLAKERRVKVVAGYSFVYVGDMARRFLAGGKSNPQTGEVNCVIELLHSCMKIDESDTHTGVS